MGLAALKGWRLIAPAALIILFAALLGWVTDTFSVPLPDLSKASYSLSLLVPGLLYYITPLRSLFNDPHHSRLVEHIRQQMVAIAGVPDRPDAYTWKALRPLFFSLIDGDESLKKKSQLAYFNGAIWTTCADATALALFYVLASLGLWWLGINTARSAAVLFGLIAVAGFLGSLSTTRKQMAIATEQTEVMELKYKQEIEARLVKLDA
jgi:hypothetical protein